MPSVLTRVALWVTLATIQTHLCHAARYRAVSHRIGSSISNIKPTHSGYLKVDKDGSSIYFAYYEAQSHSEDIGEAPILLWLQGGPGCASTFGGFYELGPWLVTEDLGVMPNPGTWNRIFGLLLMDQPVGTGYSQAAGGSSSIPTDEMGMARHLYAALQSFFYEHHWLDGRPLFITGESYAGKYVPSIAHFILQAQEDAAAADTPRLTVRRRLPDGTAAPLFHLAGVAIGNGLTDPRTQTQTLAATAYYSGLLPPALRDEVAGRAAAVVSLIDEGNWTGAHSAREALRSFLVNVTGIATEFDTRRTEGYDPTAAVDRFLNLSEVKEAMRALPGVNYTSCSDLVGAAMAGDVMRSVKQLFPDLLQHIPVLLYQGQYDILDGVASVSSWLTSLDWEQKDAFASQKGSLWHLESNNTGRGGGEGEGEGGGSGGDGAGMEGRSGDGGVWGRTVGRAAAGWRRSAGRLTHIVVYRAGHMVPHDQPVAAQRMMEGWVLEALGRKRHPGKA